MADAKRALSLRTKTLAPWSHDSEAGYFMVVEGRDYVICRGIKTEALARQLSASCEAFAAMEAVLDDLDTTAGEEGIVTDVAPETIALLRAAIAKATGSAA